MVKEAREDYKRHKADVEINNRAVDVLDTHTKKYVTKKWMDVKVGAWTGGGDQHIHQLIHVCVTGWVMYSLSLQMVIRCNVESPGNGKYWTRP